MPEYKEFANPAQAKKAFCRCRKSQMFILKDEWIAKHNPICSHCGKRFADHDNVPGYDGNRCEYDPKTGKVAILQYECSWNAIFADLFALADRLY